MIGIVVVTRLLHRLNAVYLRVLPIDEVIDVAARRGGHVRGAGRARRGAVAISALVMFSAFGALNGIILVGPRVYYQMAQDGLLVRVGGPLASDVPDAGPRDHRCRRSGRRCW